MTGAPEPLTRVAATPWLAALLASRFDFDVTRLDPAEEVRLPGGEPAHAVRR